jgi:hypothetical protein
MDPFVQNDWFSMLDYSENGLLIDHLVQGGCRPGLFPMDFSLTGFLNISKL